MLLRPFTESDVERLTELNSDPEVMRFLSPDAANDVPRYLTEGSLIAFDKATGDFLGWFEFRPIADGVVELGYRLLRSTWGKGLATEGSIALIERGFTEQGVQKVVAETMFVNAGSRRVMEKCGLRHVRTYHQDWPDPLPGSELGEVVYELTKQEWLSER